jgi:RNA polymerase-binding protein DksA
MEHEKELERSRLESEREELLDDLSRLREALKGEVKVDSEEGDPDLHEREKNLALVQTLESNLQSIDRALRALELGVYGVCERCGTQINPERLEARPDATMCLSCQREVERLAKRGLYRERSQL